MSLSRQLWLARQAPVKEAESREVAVQRLDWDDEARRNAMQEANRLMHRDPEAATLLQAQAMASVQDEPGRAVAIPRKPPYDPMQLYARMGKYYSWMSNEVIEKMDYRMFFGYVREANLMQEEEKAAYDNARYGGGASEQEAGQYFNRPRVYEGSIVKD